MDSLSKIVRDATAGPWKARVHDENTRREWWDVQPVADMWGTGEDGEEAANATFIATFDPVLVAALLDVAEAADGIVLTHGAAFRRSMGRLEAALDRLEEVRRE